MTTTSSTPEVTPTEEPVVRRPTFGRHAGFVGPATLEGRLHIVGCGATGSHIGLLAAKMGFHKFDLWDADVVEPHNLANQTYDPRHIGMNKAEALAAVLKEFNPGIEVTINPCFFVEDSVFAEPGPLVLTVDSMSGRKLLIEKAAANLNVDGVFETRLGFEFGEFNRVDNFDDGEVTNFLKGLARDEDVPDGPCNLKICTTTVWLISAFTVHQICAMYAARANDKEWTSPKRRVFELTPDLRTIKVA